MIRYYVIFEKKPHYHVNLLFYFGRLNLQTRYGSKLHWFVPDGIGTWLRDNFQIENVHDMVWWQEEALPSKKKLKLVRFFFSTF